MIFDGGARCAEVCEGDVFGEESVKKVTGKSINREGTYPARSPHPHHKPQPLSTQVDCSLFTRASNVPPCDFPS